MQTLRTPAVYLYLHLTSTKISMSQKAETQSTPTVHNHHKPMVVYWGLKGILHSKIKIVIIHLPRMSFRLHKSFVRLWNTILYIFDKNREACNCPFDWQVNSTVEVIHCAYKWLICISVIICWHWSAGPLSCLLWFEITSTKCAYPSNCNIMEVEIYWSNCFFKFCHFHFRWFAFNIVGRESLTVE